MGYMHVVNLYRPEGQLILAFKECWAMEKLHGTSSHISWNPNNKQLGFFSGGENHKKFVALFNKESLTKAFTDLAINPETSITVFGEAYGGKQQGMSGTYGKDLKFAAFEVKIGDCWLSVPDADEIVKKLGLAFVHYVKVPTDLASLDSQRDAPSIQAIRNGVSTFVEGNVIDTSRTDYIYSPVLNGTVFNPKKREGVVLRPLFEVRLNNGSRVICKHKGDDFKETKTPRPVVDPSKLQVLTEATSIAEEWVTMQRLTHVLDKIPEASMEKMEKMGEIIKAMQEDVKREGEGEVVWSDPVNKAVGKKTAELYKSYLKSKLAS